LLAFMIYFCLNLVCIFLALLAVVHPPWVMFDWIVVRVPVIVGTAALFVQFCSANRLFSWWAVVLFWLGLIIIGLINAWLSGQAAAAV